MKDNSLYILAIVAVVAVVGLVIMSTGHTVVEELPDMVEDDSSAIAGQAVFTKQYIGDLPQGVLREVETEAGYVYLDDIFSAALNLQDIQYTKEEIITIHTEAERYLNSMDSYQANMLTNQMYDMMESIQELATNNYIDGDGSYHGLGFDEHGNHGEISDTENYHSFTYYTEDADGNVAIRTTTTTDKRTGEKTVENTYYNGDEEQGTWTTTYDKDGNEKEEVYEKSDKKEESIIPEKDRFQNVVVFDQIVTPAEMALFIMSYR